MAPIKKGFEAQVSRTKAEPEGKEVSIEAKPKTIFLVDHPIKGPWESTLLTAKEPYSVFFLFILP